ncbi:MAG: SH3 domain-containing protein [Prevotella sp.]|nr:SH3 domain-containing protein [Prevotella sp.]
MKRISIILMLLFTVLTVNAQGKGFVCTGNNVNVRTGPGKNYAVYDSNTDHKRQLSKGDVVEYRGIKKNGFILIRQLGWGEDEREGWVSAQYLRPVTLCPQCDGTKDENIGEIDIELITCRKCKGKGYIK